MKKFREENEVFKKEDICPYYSVYIQMCSLDCESICLLHNAGFEECAIYAWKKIKEKKEEKLNDENRKI